ncbi:MAG: hypothetical protein ACR2QJ_05815 [Geminicoccaceae bacterium]
MNEQAPSHPKLTPRTVAGKEARSDRLAREMRKNLMKRKRQQRGKVADVGNDHPNRLDSDRER